MPILIYKRLLRSINALSPFQPIRNAIVSAVISFTLIITLPHSVGAAELTVTSGGDAGAGTLRDALGRAANGDTIRYSPSAAGTTLAAPIEFTGKNLSIVGNITPPTLLTATGGTSFRQLGGVLYGMDGNGNGLSLKNLTIANFVNSTNGTFNGAGIIGLHSNGSESAFLGTLANVRFTGNAVTIGNTAPDKDGLFGAGLIGVMSQSGQAGLGSVTGVDFYNNRVTLTDNTHAEGGRIWGAGLIGAASYYGQATVGDINGTFRGNSVNLATYLNGGGLIGSFSVENQAVIGNVRGEFIDNTVYSADNNSGGGIIGAWSGFIKPTSVAVGDIEGTFRGNRVTGAASYLRGGGIIGLRTYKGTASLGTVRADFIGNTVKVGTHLSGGGVIGLYTGNTLPLVYGGDRGKDMSVSFSGIDGSHFFGNRITVGGAEVDSLFALGSVVGVTGLNAEMIISDAVFQDNSMTVAAKKVYGLSGTVYIGTDRASLNPDGHVLTLTASPGNATVFKDNSIVITENGKTTARTSSITFGREWDGEAGRMLDSKGDAILNVAPKTGGTVALYDPIAVDMSSDKTFTMSFDSADGRLIWGGQNTFVTGGGSNVKLMRGNLSLRPDFQLTGRDATTRRKNVSVSLESALSLNLGLTGRNQNYAFFKNLSTATVGSAPVPLSASLFRFAPTSGSWVLFSNGFVGDPKAAFAVQPGDNPDLYAATGLVAGNNGKVSVTADNNGAVSIFNASAGANAFAARASGALDAAWGRFMDRVGPDADYAPVFRNILTNSAQYVPEAYADQAMVSLDWSTAVARRVFALDQLSRRTAADQAVGTSEGESHSGPALTADPSALAGSLSQSRFRVMAGYLGSNTRLDSANGYYGYNSNMNGAVLALSYDFSLAFTAGAYFSYAGGRTKYSELNSKTDVEAYVPGLYATLRPTDRLSFDFDASFGYYHNKANRSNLLGNYGDSFDQRTFGLGGTAKYDFYPGDSTRITPYAGLRWQHISQDSISEWASSAPEWALNINKLYGNSLASTLGLEVAHDFALSGGKVFTASLYADWRHEFADKQFSSSAAYQGQGATPGFTFDSAERERDSADIGAAVRALIPMQSGMVFEVNAGYGLNTTANYLNQTWFAGAGLRF